MSHKELITKIAQDKEYLVICRNISHDSLFYKDLFQEALIVLFLYDKNRIANIYRRGQIKWFLIAIFKRLYERKYGRWRHGILIEEKSYDYSVCGADRLIDYDEYDLEKDREVEEKIALVKSELNIKDDDDPLWYEKKIFLEYLDKGSIKKLSEDTKINYQSINTTIRKVKNRIIKKYEGYKEK